jgi:hypothetical protein
MVILSSVEGLNVKDGGIRHQEKINGGGKKSKRACILELLNGEGHDAFFDLTMGQW